LREIPVARRDWPQALFWAALLLLSAPIGVYALRYWSGDPALLPYELRVNFLHNPPAFVLHTTFGGLALLLAPWQFVGRLRRTYPHVHRWAGRCYVGCVAISGAAAYPVALGTVAGPIAAAGFSLMATAWLATTLLAWRAARQRRFAAHRRWMVRSFALSLSAVTLRVALLVPLQSSLDFMPIYRLTSWASWIVNLLLAELWLRLGAARPAQLVTAGAPQVAGGEVTRSQTSTGRL
jgi:Predicted membrane protein (DUF2306)